VKSLNMGNAHTRAVLAGKSAMSATAQDATRPVPGLGHGRTDGRGLTSDTEHHQAAQPDGHHRTARWVPEQRSGAWLNGNPMHIRLAVVDGHTLIRFGLSELAAQNPGLEIVAECSSMADAVSVVQAAQPDVVTADVALPDGDGMELARQLRDLRTDLGIVLLTSCAEDDVMFRALETGVSAFVPKTAPLEELLAAIRHAAVAASSFTAAGLAAALFRRRAMQDHFGLSVRENEVLQLLRRGMSTPEIARAMSISHSTAKTYVARLYEKLGAANRAQALMAAVHYGLIRYEQATPGHAEAFALQRRASGHLHAHPQPTAVGGDIRAGVQGHRQTAQRCYGRRRVGTVRVAAGLRQHGQLKDDQVRAGAYRRDRQVPRSRVAQSGQDQFDQVGHGLDVGFR
jgi:DNA-binding NarL/FixJ family response regulator